MMRAPSGPTRTSAQTHTHSSNNRPAEIALVLVQEPVTHGNKTNAKPAAHFRCVFIIKQGKQELFLFVPYLSVRQVSLH